MAVWTTNMYDIHYCCLPWAHFTCRLWPKNAAIPPRTSRTTSAFPSAWVRPSRRKRRKLPKYSSSTHLTTINNHTQDLSNSQQNHSTWNCPGFIASKARFWGLLFRQRPTSPAKIDGASRSDPHSFLGALRAGHKVWQQITQWPQTTKEWAQNHI